MADMIPNIAKGKFGYYATLPATNDAMILVLLKSSGIESDATLLDYDSLSAILAATNDECDFTGYARRTLASNTATVDDTNNRLDTDAADPSAYTNSGGSSQAAAKAVICYDPDTTGGTDADLIPCAILDCAVTFDVGVATSIAFATAGWGRAA